MAGFIDISQLRAFLEREGVRTAYIKKLSEKQDNEKNQIYFGSQLPGLINLFPARLSFREGSTSTQKRRSKAGQPIIEAKLNFAWLSRSGERFKAPHTKIIDYFQYPEVRMSGFLRDCTNPPDALRRENQRAYGQRVLVLGTGRDGTVLGLILTEREDSLVRAFPELPFVSSSGVLQILLVDQTGFEDPATILHREISAIVRQGWHWSRIMKPSGVKPFTGNQGGGYTLEALLGVVANADKKPDAHGFEIKSYSGSRISLMTPVADYGFEGEHSFREFMERFGRPSLKGDGTHRFVGLHRAGETCTGTGLAMRVTGYDPTTGTFDAENRIGVELFDADDGTIAAGWSIDKLANCWNAKHANALYIPAKCRIGERGGNEYAYGPTWVTGAGTDVFRLLRGIASGLVFYDPAHTIYADGKTKPRPQWRINSSRLPEAMQQLYASSQTATV
ncbi:MvaI/BcnI family restriction endonuclease [Citromicrobium bathyomarinum]|mgnify:CR=1 FL=1|uniref:MvaI/BcnI family restriction endonuclease n=1 Tax=Citromicrobium bathyomarinum TaxID=72174 RepID=UPI001E33924B|nr:MvaI/BcnI family restriction endonuclease [Citromicrobium bathyomarinum]MCD1623471.1 MvaI/BcnI restriction endonuclease family protein [Citromicrobium bathyomarinum]